MIKVRFQNVLGIQLRAFRKSKRLRQAQVAEMAGLSIPALRHLEQGTGHLSTWNRALSALGCVLRGRNLPTGDSIGQQVERLRKRQRVSQRALAKMTGVTQPTIIALEKCGRGRLTTLNAILSALGAGPVLSAIGETPAFYAHAGNSSAHEAWETPHWLLERLHGVFGRFDLDPCSSTRDRRIARVKASTYFIHEDDGLSLPWMGTVFVNPPYGRQLRHWISKSRSEVESGRVATVVCLVPARTDTRWWHDDIAGKATVFFLRGRLSFGDGTQPAPFPSALIVWGSTVEQIAALKAALPEAWVM